MKRRHILRLLIEHCDILEYIAELLYWEGIGDLEVTIQAH
jgi:hypothetical protein